jgi:hypothetical protein
MDGPHHWYIGNPDVIPHEKMLVDKISGPSGYRLLTIRAGGMNLIFQIGLS